VAKNKAGLLFLPLAFWSIVYQKSRLKSKLDFRAFQFSRKRRLSGLGAQWRAVSKPSGTLGQTRSLDFDTLTATQSALAGHLLKNKKTLA